jgi:hypothetical protein
LNRGRIEPFASNEFRAEYNPRVLPTSNVYSRVVRGVLCILAVNAIACGGGNDNPAAPSPAPAPAPTPPPPPAVTLSSFVIGAADASMPGQNTAGSLRLTQAAPAGGLAVTMTNANPSAVTLPTSSFTIPEGATGVTVPILTRTVASNVSVTITASGAGAALAAALDVTPGPFLAFTSSPSDPVGLGRSRRFTTSDFGFSASVSGTLDQVTVGGTSRTTSGSWSLRLNAPTGLELRAGSYSNAATSPNATTPGLQFTAFGRSCTVTGGQFVISDIAFGSGPSVERLAASFSQPCGTSILLGEVLVHP